MFKHILFPVDFSERCAQVRPVINGLLEKCDARLTLLYVVELPPVLYGIEPSYPIVADFEAIDNSARSELTKFAEGHFKPNRITLAVQDGNPGKVIVDYAETNGVDMIALPTHGYGGFRRFLLGSTTAQVLHDAKCPVWTAAHTEDPAFLEHADWRNILCAVDYRDASVPLLRSAKQFAGDFGATVTVVHALPYLDETMPANFAEGQRWFEQTARENIASMQKEAGTAFRVCVHPGNVAQVVRKSALSHHADLVLIGRGRIHETLGRMRTNAYAIIRESPCPVLSV